jgi:hypothetical protein
MKIYTKTGKTSMYFDESIVEVAYSRHRFEQGSVFWHDQHDAAQHRLYFNDFLDYSISKHLRRDPTSKILLFYGDEYFNKLDIEIIAKALIETKVPANQLYIICIDENFKKWAGDMFTELGLPNVNITVLNVLMKRVVAPPLTPTPMKYRFSTFSRNYLKFRLQLFCELIKKDILKYFDYTFNNIMPYGEVITFSHDEMLTHAEEMGYSRTSELTNWMSKVPYTLESTNQYGNGWQDKMATGIYDKLASAGISVIIESHFDPFWNFKGHSYEDFRKFSPAFPTEKTYKTIGCTKPFMVVSTPEFLKEFKQLGYKTFHPYIDETYDTIENDNDRMKAITSEIERLSNLSDQEFAEVVTKCTKIAKHNAQVMQTKQANYSFPLEFKWAEEIMVDTFAKPRVT